MSARAFGRFVLVLLILAALQFIFGDARAFDMRSGEPRAPALWGAGQPAGAGPAETLREGDEVSFALPGTTDRRCGRVASLVDHVGAPHAWIVAGTLVARLPVAVLTRGCARPARLA